jgi:tetratricopeptide (TPR) repeat protein
MRWLLTPVILVLAGSAVPAPSGDLAHMIGTWCGSGDPIRAPGPPRILEGYGPGGFPISTKSAQAQAFFDNGLQLAHAFAHQSAIDAFEEAARLDPACAMCAWGHAWSLGPTINYGVDAEKRKRAAEITATAEKLAANAPERDRKLIAALKLRYADSGGNRAFADAMEALAKAYPQDDAILTLAADAAMVAESFGGDQKRPVALLETVLKRNPDYAPAIHFYIHSTEWARFPERAEPYADRLGKVAPAASHLVHMPSHTYYWVGRYYDAGRSNLRAADLGIEQARALGVAELPDEPLPTYHLHNVHFGLGGALMAGDAEAAQAIARPFIASSDLGKTMPNFRQRVLGHAYIGLARLSDPQEVLRLPDPGKANPIAGMLWHYARGEALARQGDARRVLAEARAIPARMPQGGTVAAIATVARHVLEGRAAMLDRKWKKAADAFRKAAAAEEVFPLGSSADPPAWWYPTRRSLAAALLAAGDAEGARREADAALKRRPRDPTAHAIRAEALTRLNRTEEAARDSEEAKRGWHGEAAPGPLA